MTEITANTEVTTRELAIILGVTARWIQQLNQDGVLSTSGRNKYILSKAIQSYVEYRAANELSGSEIEKAEAELKIKKAKAVVAVLEAQELQGKMHRADDVAVVTEDLVYTIRGMLLALPGRLAIDIEHAKGSAEIAELIKKEVYAVMKELTNYKYDPVKYEERVRERRKWDVKDGNAGEVDEDN